MKVWSLIPIIPIIITCLANQNYGQEVDELSRFERAASKAPNTAPNKVPNSGSQKFKPSVSEVSSRHMKLGRIMNAVYLQTQLAKNKIDNYDVIAGIWNLKDKTVIDKLVALKIDGLSELLTNLETVINGVPDGITQIVDVETLNQKLASVKEITADMRKAMVAATEQDAIPKFITNIDAIIKIDLQDNLAQASYDAFAKLGSVSGFGSPEVHSFVTSLVKLGEVISYLPQLLEVGSFSGKGLSTLVAGMSATEQVQSRRGNFEEIVSQLASTQTLLTTFQSLNNNVEPSLLIEKMNTFQTLLHVLHDRPSNMSIAPAFVSNPSLSKVYEDFKDKWVMDVLNEGKSLEHLNNSIGHLKKFLEVFNQVDMHTNQLMSLKNSIGLGLLSDAVLQIQKLQEYSKQTNSPPSDSCIPSQDYPAIPLYTLTDLSAAVEVIQTAIPGIQKTINEIHDSKNVVTNINKYRLQLIISTDHQLAEWKNSTNYVEINTFLKNLIPSFVSLKQEDSFAAAVKKIQENKDNILATQTWINKFKIGGQECDALFNFEIDKLAGLNSVPESVNLIKTVKPISKLQPLLETIPKLSTDLQKLWDPRSLERQRLKDRSRRKKALIAATSQTKTPQKGKRAPDSDSDDDASRKLSVKKSQNLLDVAFAARSLEQMSELSQLDDVIKTFSQDGQKMSGIIKKWPSSKTKQDMKKNLTKIKKALATMTSSVPEKSLKEVGNVYSKLSKIQMSEKIELREMGESMAVFEVSNPNFRMENSKFIDALEKLDKPISMDWGMAFSSFQKVPNALIELQVDFETFFTVDNGTNDRKTVVENEIIKWSIEHHLFFIILGALTVFVVTYLVCYYRFCTRKTDTEEPLPIDEDVEKGGEKNEPKKESNSKNSKTNKSKENESKGSKSKESTSLEGQKNPSKEGAPPANGKWKEETKTAKHG